MLVCPVEPSVGGQTRPMASYTFHLAGLWETGKVRWHTRVRTAQCDCGSLLLLFDSPREDARAIQKEAKRVGALNLDILPPKQ